MAQAEGEQRQQTHARVQGDRGRDPHHYEVYSPTIYRQRSCWGKKEEGKGASGKKQSSKKREREMCFANTHWSLT